MTDFNVIINKQITISADPTGNVTIHKWFIDNVEQVGESGPTIYRTYTVLGETHTIRHEGNNDCGICNPASVEHTITVVPMDICNWITSIGGWNKLATYDIMMMVGAYLGQNNIGFTVTSSYIMGAVAYYLGRLSDGNSLTGCTFA